MLEVKAFDGLEIPPLGSGSFLASFYNDRIPHPSGGYIQDFTPYFSYQSLELWSFSKSYFSPVIEIHYKNTSDLQRCSIKKDDILGTVTLSAEAFAQIKVPSDFGDYLLHCNCKTDVSAFNALSNAVLTYVELKDRVKAILEPNDSVDKIAEVWYCLRQLFIKKEVSE